jgi:hypothetical protein
MFKIGHFSLAILSLNALNLWTSICLGQTVYQPDNETFFTGQPPVLVTAETAENWVSWPNAHYYFTFNLPKNSVESLGKVTIKQQENVETIQFNLNDTHAFIGTQRNPNKALNFTTTQDPNTQTISVNFNPPVPPGTTFTIRLEAQRNPSSSGTYLFDVTTFPAGDNPTGLPMGVGRITFYQNF